MARCIDCARFPWVSGADFSMLPPMRCVKELEARRWTKESATLEHSCPHYSGPKAVKEDDADTGTPTLPVKFIVKIPTKLPTTTLN